MEFKTTNINDIIEWCKANNQVAWLKAEIEKTETVKKHTGKITVVDENGITRTKVDKNSPVVEEQAPISFITLKYNFFNKFMADKLPVKKEKKPSMYDIIRAL